jgi:hypothetical protein
MDIYLTDLCCPKRWVKELAIHLDAGWYPNLLQLLKRHVSPFCKFMISDDGIAKEEVFTVIFRDEPVAASYEEMDVDRFIFQRYLLGFIKLREPCEMFGCWFLYRAEAKNWIASNVVWISGIGVLIKVRNEFTKGSQNSKGDHLVPF